MASWPPMTYSEATMAPDALPLLREVERANLSEPERQMLRYRVMRAGSKLAVIDAVLSGGDPTDRELRDLRARCSATSRQEDGRVPRLRPGRFLHEVTPAGSGPGVGPARASSVNRGVCRWRRKSTEPALTSEFRSGVSD
jgi:hypothetical protein